MATMQSVRAATETVSVHQSVSLMKNMLRTTICQASDSCRSLLRACANTRDGRGALLLSGFAPADLLLAR
jgi:hypothetical protein